MSTTYKHREIKALLQQVCESNGSGSLPAVDCGRVYTRRLFITNTNAIPQYFDDETRNGIKRAVAFIYRVDDEPIEEQEVETGGSVATGYRGVYEIQMLRGYHFEELDSDNEIDDAFELLRHAFDTQAVRDLFIASGYDISALRGIEFPIVNYNNLGVLFSSARSQIRVWNT